jgi:hypothetical protein
MAIIKYILQKRRFLQKHHFLSIFAKNTDFCKNANFKVFFTKTPIVAKMQKI